jgi:diaminopimelate epimerase
VNPNSLPAITIASASGNVFAYLWEEEVGESFDGSTWAKALCPRGDGLGLDGMFLLRRFITGLPWMMHHWDPDGGSTFCSNGTRAATGLLPAGFHGEVEAVVNDERVRLKVDNHGTALRMPEGPGYGLAPDEVPLDLPHVYGWTGTPHLVVEVPDVASVDLATFAPPLRHHPTLPHGANVSIVQVIEPGNARIRSWERGVEGETLCCGQGCAVAGAWLAQRTGIRNWTLMPAGKDHVQVDVDIRADGTWRDLWLKGPVRVLGTLLPGPGLDLG